MPHRLAGFPFVRRPHRFLFQRRPNRFGRHFRNGRCLIPCAVLHAYDLNDLAKKLYNSNQASSGRDGFGAGNKFITPLIAHGKVYVGITDGVGVFGSLHNPARPKSP